MRKSIIIIEEGEKMDNEIKKVKLEGKSIDEFSIDFLYVKNPDVDLEEHLNTLPPLVFYYSKLLNEAKARFDDVSSKYEFWRSQAYKIVAEELSQRGKRPTIQDINVEVDIRYENEINEWKLKIDKARVDYETTRAIVNALLVKKDTLLELARLKRVSVDSLSYIVREKENKKLSIEDAEKLLKGGKNEY